MSVSTADLLDKPSWSPMQQLLCEIHSLQGQRLKGGKPGWASQGAAELREKALHGVGVTRQPKDLCEQSQDERMHGDTAMAGLSSDDNSKEQSFMPESEGPPRGAEGHLSFLLYGPKYY